MSDQHDENENPVILEEEARVSYWTGFGLSTVVCSLLLAGLIYYDYQATPTASPPAHVTAEVIPAAIAVAEPTGKPKNKINPESLRFVEGEGDLTLVVYTDLECLYCKRFHNALTAVTPQYEGQLRVTYKHYPLPTHDRAVKEAVAAECAGQQAGLKAYIDRIFTITKSTNSLAEGKLYRAAETVELNLDLFNACMDQPQAMLDLIAQDTIEAKSIGVRSVPYAVIVDQSGKIVHRLDGAIGKQRLDNVLDTVINQAAN